MATPLSGGCSKHQLLLIPSTQKQFIDLYDCLLIHIPGPASYHKSSLVDEAHPEKNEKHKLSK